MATDLGKRKGSGSAGGGYGHCQPTLIDKRFQKKEKGKNGAPPLWGSWARISNRGGEEGVGKTDFWQDESLQSTFQSALGSRKKGKPEYKREQLSFTPRIELGESQRIALSRGSPLHLRFGAKEKVEVGPGIRAIVHQ